MGPLAGLKVVEIAGFGPGPMAGMMLADQGAAVTRVERPAGHDAGFHVDRRYFLHNRGKRLVTLDLKRPEDLAELLTLIDEADVLIEGFRPGVAERIGFGPDAVHARNPRVVYARVTAWGQDGPWSQVAAHDVNVVAATGALASIGPAKGAPTMPLNLVADFGGGAMYAVFGILAALHERQTSGQGQVVDVAMAEGALSLMTSTYGYTAAGIHKTPRGGNLLDGGVPWYGVYATADSKWVSVGALEPAFFVNLMKVLGLNPDWLARRDAQSATLREEIAAVFATASRDEWVARFAGVEACFAPVLEVAEAAVFPQFAARGSLVSIDGIVQPGIAPRFSRSVAAPLQAVAA